jgi:hypothetical protein
MKVKLRLKREGRLPLSAPASIYYHHIPSPEAEVKYTAYKSRYLENQNREMHEWHRLSAKLNRESVL